MNFCGKCRKECGIKWDVEDVGIGNYEYWGATFTDISWQAIPLSDCCGEDVFDDEACTVPCLEQYVPTDYGWGYDAD